MNRSRLDALFIAPMLGWLPLLPLLLAFNGFSGIIGISIMMIIVGIILCMLLGVPIAHLLSKKTSNSYLVNVVAGSITGLILGVLAGWVGMLIGPLWGGSTGLAYRYLIRKDLDPIDTV